MKINFNKKLERYNCRASLSNPFIYSGVIFRAVAIEISSSYS
jgi:hypothetical protein